MQTATTPVRAAARQDFTAAPPSHGKDVLDGGDPPPVSGAVGAPTIAIATPDGGSGGDITWGPTADDNFHDDDGMPRFKACQASIKPTAITRSRSNLSGSISEGIRFPSDGSSQGPSSPTTVQRTSVGDAASASSAIEDDSGDTSVADEWVTLYDMHGSEDFFLPIEAFPNANSISVAAMRKIVLRTAMCVEGCRRKCADFHDEQLNGGFQTAKKAAPELVDMKAKEKPFDDDCALAFGEWTARKIRFVAPYAPELRLTRLLAPIVGHNWTFEEWVDFVYGTRLLAANPDVKDAQWLKHLHEARRRAFQQRMLEAIQSAGPELLTDEDEKMRAQKATLEARLFTAGEGWIPTQQQWEIALFQAEYRFPGIY